MKKSQKPLPQHVSDYLDWLDVEKGLSSKTQENYSRFLKRFLDWLKENRLSSLKPHELSADHIWKYRIYLARQTRSKRSSKSLRKTTQSYYLITLRSLLTFFAERDILAIPPEKIKLPRDKGDKEVRFLSLEQLERLFSVPDISSLQGLRDRAILETFFSTGMRIAELVALNREQIEPSLNLSELELGIVGKGSRARTVYFSSRTLQWLKLYLKSRTDSDEALFINYRTRSGAPRRLTPRSIEKSIQKYALLAGLPPNTTPHVLRHSFATDLLSQGVDIRILQEFLGHKNIAATQIYAHVTSKKLKEIHRQFHSGQKLKK
ncbi:MAG: tyrosine-type recombinase/integrase [Candidatus Colwellbacteria bacterium]|nr:tyrosine-type recombinase/integrase [Candidatus Colwellbacteria bacterium]